MADPAISQAYQAGVRDGRLSQEARIHQLESALRQIDQVNKRYPRTDVYADIDRLVRAALRGA